MTLRWFLQKFSGLSVLYALAFFSFDASAWAANICADILSREHSSAEVTAATQNYLGLIRRLIAEKNAIDQESLAKILGASEPVSPFNYSVTASATDAFVLRRAFAKMIECGELQWNLIKANLSDLAAERAVQIRKRENAKQKTASIVFDFDVLFSKPREELAFEQGKDVRPEADFWVAAGEGVEKYALVRTMHPNVPDNDFEAGNRYLVRLNTLESVRWPISKTTRFTGLQQLTDGQLVVAMARPTAIKLYDAKSARVVEEIPYESIAGMASFADLGIGEAASLEELANTGDLGFYPYSGANGELGLVAVLTGESRGEPGVVKVARVDLKQKKLLNARVLPAFAKNSTRKNVHIQRTNDGKHVYLVGVNADYQVAWVDLAAESADLATLALLAKTPVRKEPFVLNVVETSRGEIFAHVAVQNARLGYVLNLTTGKTDKYGKLAGFPREAQVMEDAGGDVAVMFRVEHSVEPDGQTPKHTASTTIVRRDASGQFVPQPQKWNLNEYITGDIDVIGKFIAGNEAQILIRTFGGPFSGGYRYQFFVLGASGRVTKLKLESDSTILAIYETPDARVEALVARRKSDRLEVFQLAGPTGER